MSNMNNVYKNLLCSTLFFLQPLLFFKFYLTEVKIFSLHSTFVLSCTSLCSTSVRMFIFVFLFLSSCCTSNYVCFLSCLYELCSLLFSFTYIFSYNLFPVSFQCLLEFQPTFFLCVSSSIAFYLLTSFEFLDLRLLSQKCLDFRLLCKGTGFSYTVPSFFTLQGPGFFVTLQDTLVHKSADRQSALVRTESGKKMAVCAYNGDKQRKKSLKAEFMTAG